jgi:Mn-dependent DtxR family transcriptional regulator
MNRLLSALPEAELQALQPSFERVRLNGGDVIHHPIVPSTALYFPEDCIISNLTVFDDGASVESGLVGSEGMTGTELLMSNSVLTRETCVQTSGYSIRIEAKNFRPVFDRSAVLQRFVTNYTSAFFNQIAQVGACSSHHTVVQRLARLLLMCNDRTEKNKIKITQDHLAQMLCVHRPSVTLAASALKDEGMIDYVRGNIAVLDEKRLESVACECYHTISENYRQFLLSLELRTLHDRAERAERDLATEMERRHRLATETRTHINRLKERTNRITEVSGDHYLCVGCHNYVLSESGEWKPIEAFLSNRLSLTVHSELCPACIKKSLYNGAAAA